MKKFVEFYYPGLMVSETRVQGIAERDVENMEIPRGAFGFRFFDAAEGNGERHNETGLFYLGKLYNMDDVKREVPDSDILILNMRSNGYLHVVGTKSGQFFPVKKGDVVLNPETRAVAYIEDKGLVKYPEAMTLQERIMFGIKEGANKKPHLNRPKRPGPKTPGM